MFDPMNARAEAEAERAERERIDAARKVVLQAAEAHQQDLDSLPGGYGYAVGPEGITVFIEKQSSKFGERLKALRQSLLKWCVEHRVPPIPVKVVEEPKPVRP